MHECRSCKSGLELSNEYLLLSIYLQKSASIQPRTSPPKFQISFPPRKFSFISVSDRGRAAAPCAYRRGAPHSGGVRPTVSRWRHPPSRPTRAVNKDRASSAPRSVYDLETHDKLRTECFSRFFEFRSLQKKIFSLCVVGTRL